MEQKTWDEMTSSERHEMVASVREQHRGKRKREKAEAKLLKQPIKIVAQPKRKPRKKRVRTRVEDVTSDAFLLTFEWRKLRMQALKKYGPRCMCCGATPATGAVMNVDHIKPRKKHPDLALDINNLQILCHDCNHGKGNWDQTDWRPR